MYIYVSVEIQYDKTTYFILFNEAYSYVEIGYDRLTKYEKYHTYMDVSMNDINYDRLHNMK